jgi:hypothetical protein
MIFSDTELIDIIKSKECPSDVPLYIKDINDDIPFTITEDIVNKYNIHNGQRKLLLTELVFLGMIRKLKKIPGLVIYIGAAPGLHIPLLIKMNPQHKYLLIDKNKFTSKINHYKLKNNYNFVYLYKLMKNHDVFVYNEYMTSNIAYQLANLKMPIYMISDIRTQFMTDNKFNAVSDADIYINCAQQLAWFDIIKPNCSMFKFRLPFFHQTDEEHLQKQIDLMKNNEDIEYCKINMNIDFIQQFKDRTLRYLDGKILLQPWTKTTSTETRLIRMVNSKVLKTYDISYRDKLMFWNNVIRCGKFRGLCDRQELCGDCQFEYTVLKKYYNEKLIELGYRDIHEFQKEINDLIYIKNKKCCL